MSGNILSTNSFLQINLETPDKQKKLSEELNDLSIKSKELFEKLKKDNLNRSDKKELIRLLNSCEELKLELKNDNQHRWFDLPDNIKVLNDLNIIKIESEEDVPDQWGLNPLQDVIEIKKHGSLELEFADKLGEAKDLFDRIVSSIKILEDREKELNRLLDLLNENEEFRGNNDSFSEWFLWSDEIDNIERLEKVGIICENNTWRFVDNYEECIKLYLGELRN